MRYTLANCSARGKYTPEQISQHHAHAQERARLQFPAKGPYPSLVDGRRLMTPAMPVASMLAFSD
jgi:hypothetical protein